MLFLDPNEGTYTNTHRNVIKNPTLYSSACPLSVQLNDAETVAAVSYILYAITHPDVLSPPSPPDPPSPPLAVTIDRSHIRSL